MKNTAIVALAATFMLTACAQQTFVMDGNTKGLNNENLQFSEEVLETTRGADKIEHEHFFLSGIGQSQAINAAKVCGSASRVARVETKQNVLQGLLSFITLGIYTPREASVYCR
tara:strand:- start:7 stop:348 length:342 start_codon:yes stop_codon:yes gene_type:complete